KLKIPFIAITGSNGKTTTKELIKSILSKKYKTLATIGNLNNHIGVPLTILSVTPDIEIAVIEMGANHIGEIAMLCEIAQPDYGLITNIGKAHIGEFGSFENIVKAKSELYDFIRKKNGKVFINTENDLLMKNAEGIEKISYGNSENNFSQCEFIEANPNLKVKYENEIISSNLIGKYNFENISAAICIGKYFGIDDKKIKEAIEEYVPSNNRSQAVQTKNNSLILDAYNANPSSMQAALGNFYDMEGENKWLILGDMLELGKYETEEHATILKQIAEKKFQNVILVGERFSKAVSELKISFPNLFLFKTSDELSEKLKSDSPIKNSSLILIKGSRGMKLEKVVEFL
ncbi:MAG: UDP-N-acetylmuramoyl-tripeptide--D-alanyl-D-alanine ligase, partial [Bacteroidetes bacterium]|nr:UDP-N-acetylmuramoyl-tripeptide--D-alanyl-D-alanine ligase [Bacteroidota bacterium]